MLYVVLLNLTEELQRQYDVDTILARDVEINCLLGVLYHMNVDTTSVIDNSFVCFRYFCSVLSHSLILKTTF